MSASEEEAGAGGLRATGALGELAGQRAASSSVATNHLGATGEADGARMSYARRIGRRLGRLQPTGPLVPGGVPPRTRPRFRLRADTPLVATCSPMLPADPAPPAIGRWAGVARDFRGSPVQRGTARGSRPGPVPAGSPRMELVRKRTKRRAVAFPSRARTGRVTAGSASPKRPDDQERPERDERPQRDPASDEQHDDHHPGQQRPVDDGRRTAGRRPASRPTEISSFRSPCPIAPAPNGIDSRKRTPGSGARPRSQRQRSGATSGLSPASVHDERERDRRQREHIRQQPLVEVGGEQQRRGRRE